MLGLKVLGFLHASDANHHHSHDTEVLPKTRQEAGGHSEYTKRAFDALRAADANLSRGLDENALRAGHLRARPAAAAAAPRPGAASHRGRGPAAPLLHLRPRGRASGGGRGGGPPAARPVRQRHGRRPEQSADFSRRLGARGVARPLHRACVHLAHEPGQSGDRDSRTNRAHARVAHCVVARIVTMLTKTPKRVDRCAVRVEKPTVSTSLTCFVKLSREGGVEPGARVEPGGGGEGE
eukprot:1194861-Prorocentrum_minimum.AAC.2